jgi:protein-S-isoprenylcysteine O-methyltransferase Ste14
MLLNHLLVLRFIQALWLIGLLYWILCAFNNKKSIYRQSRRSRWYFVLGLFIAFYCVARFEQFDAALFSITLFTQVLGMALCTSGILLAIWARTILGTNWSGIVTLKENHELIRNGPYAFVRHPIYCGIIVAFLGTILALYPSVRGLIDLVIIIILFLIKSRMEENLMMRQFPEEYPKYKQEVRGGLLPFIL